MSRSLLALLLVSSVLCACHLPAAASPYQWSRSLLGLGQRQRDVKAAVATADAAAAASPRISVLTGEPVVSTLGQCSHDGSRRQALTAAAPGPTETIVSSYLNKIRGNRAHLTRFMNSMPKGGDIHLHYSGAVYTESYINFAITNNHLYCETSGAVVTTAAADNTCRWRHLNETATDSAFSVEVFQTLLRKWSVYQFQATPGGLEAPADHFFNVFGHFSAVEFANVTVGLQELKDRALDENMSYLELMYGAGPLTPVNNYDSMTAQMLDMQASGNESAFMDLLEHIWSREINHTALAQQTRDSAQLYEELLAPIDEPGFTMRFQLFGVRLLPPVLVLGMLVGCFDVSNVSAAVVGCNLVAQENNPTSLRDFWLHMRMFKFLKSKYPDVNIALHAGEMKLGMVPPEQLRFHIHDSVFVGGAQRIGHGVDIFWEANSSALLKHMADQQVVAEINLGSNAFILGIDEDLHANGLYLDSDVPCIIGSDDPGILRDSISQNFVMLANNYKYITYAKVKELVRNSIKHSFIKEDSVKAALMASLEVKFQAFEKAVIAEAGFAHPDVR